MEELRAKKIKGPGGLREEAKKYGVKYASKMKKEELISLIEGMRHMKNGEDTYFDRNELIEVANQVGISRVTNKSKQRLINEIRFKKTDTADRELHAPSYYEDKTDEELVKDLFMQDKKRYAAYLLDNKLGYLGNPSNRKVNHMEVLFVNIRAGCEVKTLNYDVCGELKKGEDGMPYILHHGIKVEATFDSPHYAHVMSIADVMRNKERLGLFPLDERAEWNKESLLSLLSLLGCAKTRVSGYDNFDLLSLLIILEEKTYFASVYGEKNVTHLDLRKRFYKACRDLGKQAFFINASRAKNSDKGKRLAKQMEERDMYFERGIGWVSMHDDNDY